MDSRRSRSVAALNGLSPARRRPDFGIAIDSFAPGSAAPRCRFYLPVHRGLDVSRLITRSRISPLGSDSASVFQT